MEQPFLGAPDIDAIIFFAFLGVFVSATGTLIGPIVAGMAPDRRNYVATFNTMMVIVHGRELIAFGLLAVALVQYLPLMLALTSAGKGGQFAHILERLQIVYHLDQRLNLRLRQR